MNKEEYSLADDKNNNLALEHFFQGIYEKFSLQGFDRVYLFSNEPLSAHFSNCDLMDKSALIVGSSGDQLLNMLYYGAKNVTVADISSYFQEFIEYKMAAIENLSYDEFKNFIMKLDLTNPKIYAKLSHSMSSKAREFWDMLFLELDEDNLRTLPLLMFQHCGFNKNGFQYSEFYNNEESFNKLKQILQQRQFEIDYLYSDLFDFSDRTKGNKFDYIYLSNIEEHVKNFDKPVVQLIKSNLNKDGKLQYVLAVKNKGESHRQFWTSKFGEDNVETFDINEKVKNKFNGEDSERFIETVVSINNPEKVELLEK